MVETLRRSIVTRRWFGSSLLDRELRNLGHSEAVRIYHQIKRSLIPHEEIQLWDTGLRKEMLKHVEPDLKEETNAHTK